MVARSTSRCAFSVEQKFGTLGQAGKQPELPSAVASVSSGPSGARHGARDGLRTHVRPILGSRPPWTPGLAAAAPPPSRLEPLCCRRPSATAHFTPCIRFAALRTCLMMCWSACLPKLAHTTGKAAAPHAGDERLRLFFH